MIGLPDILKARENLQGISHVTNLDMSATFSEMSGCKVYLKTENLQKTGSFKIRGAYNKIASLTVEEKSHGVIAASAGNHAQGVAYAAGKSGIAATIVMPETAPLSKVMATRSYGAKVVLHGHLFDDADAKAREIRASLGASFIHAFDDPYVIAGQGTIGLEILDSLPDVDIIFIPIGGGGLASGISLAVKSQRPGVKIIGVEAEGAACLKASFEAGKICGLTSAGTIADGIAVKCPGSLTFDILSKYIDAVVTVNDEEIASTMLLLMERSKLLVEGAGAVALAAILYDKYPAAGKNAVAIVSGGNVDVNFISRIIEKGLAKAGRHLRIVTTVEDRPGSLQAFLQIVAQERGNVISINHDRSRARLPLDKAIVEAVLETQSPEHGERIVHALIHRGFGVSFSEDI